MQCKMFIALVMFVLFTMTTQSQENEWKKISLDSYSSFREYGDNWLIGSDVLADSAKTKFLPVKGTGTFINKPSGSTGSHLVTKNEFGDLELELEFMMAAGSNSGIYLQGRYEIQLYDSYKKTNVTYIDCGAVYQRWDESREHKGYEGSAPLVNACKLPGAWQQLKISFRAPRFDSEGKKIKNAYFPAVYLNGRQVQANVNVTGPTRASLYDDEKPLGPLMIQGDHGVVAIRNIRYTVPR